MSTQARFRVGARIAVVVSIAFGGLFLSLASMADEFPRTPVKIVVPFPPGGPTDTVARLIGVKLQETWSQPAVIDYKPGAGTAIGIDAVAKSSPNGYTIGMVNAALPVLPALRKKLPYDTLRDLAPITQIVNLHLAIVARSDAPFNTLAELLAYAKKNPGKLTYGTPGIGSTAHLGAELLEREAGFSMLHSPMKGSAPAHTELMGGRLDLVIDPFVSVLPYVQAGRMKMIATLGQRRVPGYEQYPTVSETIPGFTVGAMLGFVAPAGTPKEIVQKLQQDIAKVVTAADTRRRLEDLGMEVVASTPEQFDVLIQAELKKWARIVADAKIETD